MRSCTANPISQSSIILSPEQTPIKVVQSHCQCAFDQQQRRHLVLLRINIIQIFRIHPEEKTSNQTTKPSPMCHYLCYYYLRSRSLFFFKTRTARWLLAVKKIVLDLFRTFTCTSEWNLIRKETVFLKVSTRCTWFFMIWLRVCDSNCFQNT